MYYLSELVEERTVLTRKLLTRLIYTIIALHLLLAVIDRFPFWLSLFGVASHGIYMANLRHFPIVKLSDPVFVLSCGKLNSLLYFFFLPVALVRLLFKVEVLGLGGC